MSRFEQNIFQESSFASPRSNGYEILIRKTWSAVIKDFSVEFLIKDSLLHLKIKTIGILQIFYNSMKFV